MSFFLPSSVPVGNCNWTELVLFFIPPTTPPTQPGKYWFNHLQDPNIREIGRRPICLFFHIWHTMWQSELHGQSSLGLGLGAVCHVATCLVLTMTGVCWSSNFYILSPQSVFGQRVGEEWTCLGTLHGWGMYRPPPWRVTGGGLDTTCSSWSCARCSTMFTCLTTCLLFLRDLQFFSCTIWRWKIKINHGDKSGSWSMVYQ